jgi:hypothetical protein
MPIDSDTDETQGWATRPRLRDIDHGAPDGVSAGGVFDRGATERAAHERASEGTDR